MNEVARKVYYLLLTKPPWFDMNNHTTCIAGATFRVVEGRMPTINDWFCSSEASKHLGIDAADGEQLMLYHNLEGSRYDPIEAANRLKAVCDDEVYPLEGV
jgi:hypothetical protein